HMVQIVTSTPEWKQGDIGGALKAAFFKIDEKIASGEAAAELEEIATATAERDKKIREAQDAEGGEEDGEDADNPIMSSVREAIRLAYTNGVGSVGNDDEEEDDEGEDEEGDEEEEGEEEGESEEDEADDEEEEGDEDEE